MGNTNSENTQVEFVINLTPRLRWLWENRIARLVARLKQRENIILSAQQAFTDLCAADPSANKSAVQWLMETYMRDGFRWEDLLGGKTSKVSKTLENFARYKKYLDTNRRNLYSNNTLSEVYQSVESYIQEADDKKLKNQPYNLSSNQKKQKEKSTVYQQTYTLTDEDNFKIIVPLTEQSARWWGQGTQWCTSARENNQFDHYNQIAPLLIILFKDQTQKARKLQLYVYKNNFQFMDETDSEVEPELIIENWEKFKTLIFWSAEQSSQALDYLPENQKFENLLERLILKNPQALEGIPDHFLTPDLCLMALKSNSQLLKYIPKHFIDSDFLKAALRSNPAFIMDYRIDLESKLDSEICEWIVQNKGWLIHYIPEKFFTEQLVLTAFQGKGANIGNIKKKWLTLDVCLTAVENDSMCIKTIINNKLFDNDQLDLLLLKSLEKDDRALSVIPLEMRTVEIYQAAIKNGTENFALIPKTMWTSSMALKAVERNPNSIKHFPKNIINESIIFSAIEKSNNVKNVLNCLPKNLWNEQTIDHAIEKQPNVIDIIPKHLLDAQKYTKAAQIDGSCLKYIPPQFISSQMCEIAVEQSGLNLQCFSNQIQTAEINRKAVKNNSMALRHVLYSMRTDELCKLAVEKDVYALQYVPDEFKTKELLLSAVKKDGRILQYIKLSSRTIDLCLIAVQNNIECKQFVPKNLRKQILELVPECGNFEKKDSSKQKNHKQSEWNIDSLQSSFSSVTDQVKQGFYSDQTHTNDLDQNSVKV